MIDIIMYILRSYIQKQESSHIDEDEVVEHLQDIGFNLMDIHHALSWIEGLAELRRNASDTPILPPQADKPLRVFSDYERLRFTPEAQNLLYLLENNGILDAHYRELVIDRALALGDEEIDTSSLKWVVLMVLLNTADGDDKLAWMLNFVLGNRSKQLAQ
jgi:Smg protein